MKKLMFILLFTLFLGSEMFAQSIGLTLESNSFSIYSLFYSGVPARGNIKNVFVSFAYPFNEKIQSNLRMGYSWNVFENVSSRTSPTVYEKIETYNTNGYPIELELKYSEELFKGLNFHPFLAVGAGYYTLKTTCKVDGEGSNKYDYEFDTKGFCGIISFGVDYKISSKFSSTLQFKHYAINGLRTKGDIYGTHYESDYSNTITTFPLSISLGIEYKL